MGVSIRELEQGTFLFQFFHKDDMQWVINRGPWMFDNTMMILEKIADGEDPLQVQLWHLNIWIQLYELSMSFMTEIVGQQLGNFFGEFLQYDVKNNSSIWREYMRIRIRLDVRMPLKRKKRIVKKDGKEFTVTCKYERLGEFCFSCGMVTHTDRFCRKSIGKRDVEIEKEWGQWLKTAPRRAANMGQSRWLRDEDDATWELRGGKNNQYRNFRGRDGSNKGKEIIMESNSRDVVATESRDISNNNKLAGFSTFSNAVYGPEENEDIGLKLDERKRRRGDPTSNSIMDIDVGLKNTETQNILQLSDSAISTKDLAVSSQSIPAKPVEQASRLK